MRSTRVTEIFTVIVDDVTDDVADDQGDQVALPARLCAECLSVLPVGGVDIAAQIITGALDDHQLRQDARPQPSTPRQA